MDFNLRNNKPLRLFILLSGFFVANVFIAEFIGVKIFSLEDNLGIDRFSFSLFGMENLSFALTAGVLLWPIVFVMTDVINEYYGKRGVRMLSFLAVTLIIYAFGMFYVGMQLIPADWWPASKQHIVQVIETPIIKTNGEQLYAGGEIQRTSGVYQDTIKDIKSKDSIILVTHLYFILDSVRNVNASFISADSSLQLDMTAFNYWQQNENLLYAYSSDSIPINAIAFNSIETQSTITQGIQDMNAAFKAIFGQGLWIIIGSIVAFLIGQILDVFIFHRIKKATGDKMVWLRATGSTLFSQLIDSYVVLFIAFYIGAGWDWRLVLAIGCVNYMYKVALAIGLTPVIYLAHFIIDRYLGHGLAKRLKAKAARG